ncbi:MAG: aminotransferase class I/II-fold pyridoxal phosphate-dependent enzyme [Deltaproteobacteria bacterium]|nr:aminotransferase class I/II-fold pyridoxal phosphate-dependent enzyme [Deltaproteobacteria bacterium]
MNNNQELHIAVNQNIMEMEYAVRGPIPKRAAELIKQGMTTIPCNIGNPQAFGQKPISYYRQVLSLVEDPSKIARERKLNTILKHNIDALSGLNNTDFISDHVLNLSESFLVKTEIGLGAYSESNGPLFIREAIARFIDKRDEVDTSHGVSANPDNIFITNGASEGARRIIDLLIADKNDGIMIPIPQYPLYSATIKRSGGVQVNYYPDEDDGWSLNRSILEEALDFAIKDGVNVKGVVVINPGNPTGGILDEETIREVIDFAKKNSLVIIADEVYQENVYGAEFVSFAKVLGDEKVPLFSLHSISKGFIGECGHRGGYLEIRNPPKVLGNDVSFIDVILKQASVSLCSNTVGQLLVYLMVNSPEEGSAPYRQFVEEKQSILNDLYDKATMIREGLNQMDAVECFGRTGAMYLFPRLNKLPEGSTDFDYCMNLLEKTGLCTVNGSGFGQKEGTHHLRIAFLPSKGLLDRVLPEWIMFHNEYVNK